MVSKSRGLLRETIRCMAIISLLTVSIASAQSARDAAQSPDGGGWITGVKATVTNIDNDTLTLDMTGTVWYTTGVTFGTAFVGVETAGGPIVPAVDWGDGSTVPPYWPGGSGIPFVGTSTPPGAAGPLRAYQMAFSHVYASEGDYTITINSHFTGGLDVSAFTGNVQSAATSGGSQSFLSNQNVNTPNGGSATFVTVGAQASPTIAIDTVSDIGLLLLGLALGLAGLFLLRR